MRYLNICATTRAKVVADELRISRRRRLPVQQPSSSVSAIPVHSFVAVASTRDSFSTKSDVEPSVTGVQLVIGLPPTIRLSDIPSAQPGTSPVISVSPMSVEKRSVFTMSRRVEPGTHTAMAMHGCLGSSQPQVIGSVNSVPRQSTAVSSILDSNKFTDTPHSPALPQSQSPSDDMEMLRQSR